MRPAPLWSLIATALLFPQAALAQPQENEQSPILQIKTLGPSSYVSALAFSPDGNTLYAGGWDKVVHVWQFDERAGELQYQPDRVFRVPIGPGTFGGVNAISVSADGRWLAVAGSGPARGLAGFRDKTAWVLPSAALTDAQRLDLGSIYVFDTNDRSTRILRGHNAPVVAMQFVDANGKPTLVSAAEQALESGFAGALRVWDVEEGTPIAKLEQVPVPRAGVSPAQWQWRRLPSPAGWKPGLAAWSTGDGPKDLRVAIAWGDNDADRRQGMFRVWDVRTGQVSTSETGLYPLVVAALPGPMLATRLFAGAHRELGVWSVPAGRGGALPALARQRNFSPLADLGANNLPKSAALFASRPGGSTDRAAVVVQQQRNATGSMDLVLVDLAGRQVLGERVRLWEGPLTELKDPTIAATGQGGRLAVAGNKDHAIRVYDIRKLLAGDTRSPQLLYGAGLSWQNVAFVKNGDALGLQLRAADADNKQRRLTFDITNRAVVDDPAGWQPDRPGQAQWRAVHDKAGRRVRVISDNQPFGTPIVEAVDRPITAIAIAPPSENDAIPPLVAVATHRLGDPQLSLFDARTGKELRQFAGHVERLRDLAFSADGRLLASVADDRTVRLWWVADIAEETLDKLGRISGLLVEEQENGLVVARVEAGSPAAGKLRAGDVVVSATTEDGPLAFKTRWDFYQFLAVTAPGTQVSLSVERGGQQRAIELAVEQGIDRRNPLFSLFFNPDDEEDAVSWIGWHPIGPYDHSDRTAERFLGWHFNTGDAKSPTRFASADQYRNNYDEGLLGRLIEQGPPGVVPPPQPPPKLDMDVSLVSADGDTWSAKYEDFAFIRKSKLTALIKIDGFPLNRLKAIEWKLNDGEPQPVEEALTSGTFQADLPEPTRGRHTLTVTAVSADSSVTFPAQKMTFLYLPPRPSIEVPPKSLPEETSEPMVTLKATLENAEFAGPLDVELLHNGKQVKTWTTPAGKALEISHAVTLAEGRNSLKLLARNADALQDHAADETASMTRWVHYERVPGPPVITITQVLRVDDGQPLEFSSEKPLTQPSPPGRGQDEGEEEAAAAQRLVEIDAPQIRIKGTVTAPDPLADVRFLSPQSEEGQTPAKFEADKQKQFAFDETISLEPGRQTITLRAATTRSKRAEEAVVVNYLPLLPSVAHVALQAGPADKPVVLLPDNDVDLFRGSDPQTVTLRVRIEHPRDSHAAQAQLEINGEAVGEPMAVDAETTELKQEVELLPGANAIRVTLVSQWRPDARTTPAVTLNYRRPPVVAAVDPKPDDDGKLADRRGKPFFNFSAEVASDADRPLTSVEAIVNGVAAAADTVSVEQDQTDKTLWKVAVRDAPLDQGANHFRLIAHNADGASSPVEFFVNQLPPASRPDILLVSPADTNTKISSTEVTIEFKVRTESPLSRVDLVLGSGEAASVRRVPLEIGAADAAQPNLYSFSRLVTLERGVNNLKIEAYNEGGRATKAAYVNVVLPPITIALDKVVPHLRPEQTIATRQFRDGGVHLEETAPGGHVTLHGHVEWQIDAEARKRIADSRVVRVWVNGFLRMAHLTPVAGSRDRADFQLDVILNRTSNRIEFEHAELPVRDDNQQFHLACLDPERRQHLHLVMVGVRKVAERPVQPAVIEAHAREALLSNVESNAFARIESYGPLAGPDAVNGRIKALLLAVVNRINARSRQQQFNDVVVVYYHGKETMGKSGRFLLADFRNWDNPERDRAAISSTYLSDVLNNQIPGAHLVLLDVNHLGEKVAQRWPREPYLGMLRVTAADDVHLLSELQESIAAFGDGKEVQLREIEAALRERLQTTPGSRGLDSNIPVVLEDLNFGPSE